MNKNALLDYALFARRELETQIALSLNNLGITKDGVANIKRVGDVYAIDGIQDSISQRVYELRKRIIDSHINNAKFEDVVEEFAFTWFNRIVAIRFMEVHDYFPHGFRVLSSRDGSYEPEILKNLPFVAAELKLDEKRVATYQEQNRLEDLYRYVLVQQCNALKDIIPMLFEEQGAYLELLLPSNLLSHDSIIRRIEDVPEEDFLNDIEIVGWLYQFYNSVKKDEVFASKKKITKETLPAVTQLFTPDWIVRYMAENSIGRIWMESYPSSPMKSEMKYYVDDVEQTEEVQKRIDEIKYKNVKPEDIRIIEPCCGSGHILVYAFDLLNQMYLEKGYEKREIPGLILKNNLYGLDVDKRAAQLAQFALIMKARSIDNRFFNEGRFVLPKVYEIVDSQSIEDEFRAHMKTLKFSKGSIETAYYLVKTFKDGKLIGSLLRVEERDYLSFINEIEKVREGDIPGLFEQLFFNYGLVTLKQLAELAIVLSQKYDVMITNPPYCGSSSLEDVAKKYALENYPDSKTDMFAMFMETAFEKETGFKAMINMHSWMFLPSYENLRKSILLGRIVNMIHLGTRAFEEISGEVVQTTTFVYQKQRVEGFLAKYVRLVDFPSQQEKERQFFNTNNSIVANTDIFRDMPSSIISYWASENTYRAFREYSTVSDYGDARQGMATGDNNRFVRLWYEPDFNAIGFGCHSYDEFKSTRKKYVPYTKSAGLCRWYGNYYNVLKFDEHNYEELSHSGNCLPSRQYYFRENANWSLISTGSFGARYSYAGSVFDVGAHAFYGDKNVLKILGYLNSVVFEHFIKFLSPTINYNSGIVAKVPTLPIPDSVEIIVRDNVAMAKKLWDMNEYSWDFLRHPLIRDAESIENALLIHVDEVKKTLTQIASNEARLNELFIEQYELGGELDAGQEEVEYTSLIERNNVIKSFLSYVIGCILGRYSPHTDGLVYAGGDWDLSKYLLFQPDDDGIIPVYQFIGIEDGLTKSICEFIKCIYGEKYYQENLNYIADSLKRKTNESAEETINNYINDGFYEDHLKTYQKRPIYWMLSSGKQGAFKCLIYLHRYNKNTLATVNTKYFLPRTAMYKAERERLQARLDSGTLDVREKKNVEAELKTIEKCEEELLEYGQVLDYLANQYIELDLDDGVKENYLKFQRIPLEVNGARVKKDLLVPFGLEKDKK